MFLNGLRRQICRVLSENRILTVPVGVVNLRKSAGAFLTSNDSCVTNKVLLGRSLKLSGRCRGVSVEYILERRLVFAEQLLQTIVLIPLPCIVSIPNFAHL